MTNATKAVIIALINALAQFGSAFGLYELSGEQTNAILTLVNVLGAVLVIATRKNSPKRIPDA